MDCRTGGVLDAFVGDDWPVPARHIPARQIPAKHIPVKWALAAGSAAVTARIRDAL